MPSGLVENRRGSHSSSDPGQGVGMNIVPASAQVWMVAGRTDMRRGFTGLSGMVQQTLNLDPFSGHVFVFRGHRGDLIKVLWWDGDGMCLFAKRLERGRFVWPQAEDGIDFVVISVTDSIPEPGTGFGNQATSQDPAGKTIRRTYDPIDRLMQVNEDSSGVNHITNYSYDVSQGRYEVFMTLSWQNVFRTANIAE